MAQEVKQWITVNGVHVPIFDGETKQQAVDKYLKNKKRANDDADKKDKQIEANRKQAEEKNNENKETHYDGYSKMYASGNRTPEEIRFRFERDTNVRVNPSVLKNVPEDKQAEIYDVVRDIKDKYNADIRQITMIPADSPDVDDRMADMNNDGVMRLSPKYFNDPEAMKRSHISNKDMFINHTVYSDDDGYKNTVAHELGHGILLRRMNDWYDKVSKDDFSAYDYYMETENYLSCKTVNGYASPVSTGNKLQRSLEQVFNKIEDKLNNDSEIQKKWGGKPNIGILGFANPNFSMKGVAVSAYAGKNYHELVAESFCDVYCNGYNNASIVSQEVYDNIIEGDWWK